MKPIESQAFATHNLEILGSSPRWATAMKVGENRNGILLIFLADHTEILRDCHVKHKF